MVYGESYSVAVSYMERLEVRFDLVSITRQSCGEICKLEDSLPAIPSCQVSTCETQAAQQRIQALHAKQAASREAEHLSTVRPGVAESHNGRRNRSCCCCWWWWWWTTTTTTMTTLNGEEDGGGRGGRGGGATFVSTQRSHEFVMQGYLLLHTQIKYWVYLYDLYAMIFWVSLSQSTCYRKGWPELRVNDSES